MAPPVVLTVGLFTLSNTSLAMTGVLHSTYLQLHHGVMNPTTDGILTTWPPGPVGRSSPSFQDPATCRNTTSKLDSPARTQSCSVHLAQRSLLKYWLLLCSGENLPPHLQCEPQDHHCCCISPNSRTPAQAYLQVLCSLCIRV